MKSTLSPLLLLAAVAPAPTFAQEKSLATVEVIDQRGAQSERKHSEIQKIVIAEEEVERFGDATVGDVLRRLPGISVTGPAGVTKDVRMRGLDKGYTQFLINGEPVPSAKQERQIQIDRLPADMIERIEIIRNPSAEYDAMGIGGTINIVLKNRADDMTRLRAAWGKNGSLSVGDVVAQWSRSLDNMDILLAASHTVGAEDIVEEKDTLNAAGAITKREFKPKPVEKAETLLAPRITWRFGGDKLTLEPFISAGTEDKRETPQVRNLAGVLQESTDKTENKTDTIARLGGRYDGIAGWGEWYAKAGIQSGKEDKDNIETKRNGAGVINSRKKDEETIDEEQVYLGGGIVLPVGQAHRVKAGIEARHTDYDKRKTSMTANNATNPLTAAAPGANDIYAIREQKATFYLQDEWHLAKHHWLTPGLRYDRTARDAQARTGLSSSTSTTAANPSLHYRWAIDKSLNLRASLAQTLKLPKFDDVNPLVTLKAGNAADPDTAGNPDLKPERATGLELGFEKYLAGDRGVVGVNLYSREVKDFIEKVTRTEAGREVKRPQNVGDARFYGLELDWRVPLLRNSAHLVNLTGSHSEMRGRTLKSTTKQYQDVKDMPPRISNLGIDWKHRPSGWAAGFNVNHVPSYVGDTDNDAGEREVKRAGKQTLLDLYVTKVFSPLAEIRLIAKNVLSIDKIEDKTKYNANGTVKDGEWKVEHSKPTIYLTFESRF